MSPHRIVLVSLVLAAGGAFALACGDDPEPAPLAPAATGGGDAAASASGDAASAADGAADAKPPQGKDVAADVAAFDAKLAAAICERLSSCCAQADYDGFFARFSQKPYTLAAPPPAASCATELAAQLAVMHDKWVASVGRGRMTFDGARASKCVSDVGAAACGAPLLEQIYGAACLGVRGNEVFAKIAPVGSDCTDLGDGTFYGECDPKQGYCDETKKCAAWKKTGEPCGILLQDAGPTRRLFCAPDLNCDGQSPKTPGKCSGPPVTKAIGESCSASTGPTELCPAGAFCDLFGSGKCTPKKPDGADCAYDDECTSERPLTCGPQGSAKCGRTACGGKP